MSMKTLKNKIYAIVLVGIGVAATFLLEEGIGVLIFMLMFAVPLFFAKENWIVDTYDLSEMMSAIYNEFIQLGV